MSIIWRERHPVSFALCPNWFEIKIHNSEINVWLKQPLNYWTKRTWEGSSCLRSKIRHGLFLETIKISVFKRSWVMKSPIIVSQVQLVCAEQKLCLGPGQHLILGFLRSEIQSFIWNQCIEVTCPTKKYSFVDTTVMCKRHHFSFLSHLGICLEKPETGPSGIYVSAIPTSLKR